MRTSKRKRRKLKKEQAIATTAATLEPASIKPSRLLLLPPELRNQIYEYVFDQADFHVHGEDTQPALTRTCHIIRNEALPIFYTLNHIQINLRWRHKGQKWISSAALPSDRVLSCVKWLKITFSYAKVECYLHLGRDETVLRIFGTNRRMSEIEQLVKDYINLKGSSTVVSGVVIAQIAKFVLPKRPSKKGNQRKKQYR